MMAISFSAPHLFVTANQAHPVCFGLAAKGWWGWKRRPFSWKNRRAMKPAGVSRLVTCARTMSQTAGTIIPDHEEPPMKKLSFGALIAIAASAIASAALAQDAAAGKTSFNKCLACHAAGEGAKNKVGPVLNGLDGRKSGTVEGYSYSDANKNSGITWNKDQFLDYIKDPKAKIPNTKMIFPGIKNEKEANDLWAFLAQYDKDGKTK
jgi:cytochrome c